VKDKDEKRKKVAEKDLTDFVSELAEARTCCGPTARTHY